MAILAIIFGILLILFGGGCTLIMGGIMISDPSSMSDLGTLLSILLPLGVLPLGIGILLLRWGVKKDRERRAAKPRK
jgi:hypothetical protein